MQPQQNIKWPSLFSGCVVIKSTDVCTLMKCCQYVVVFQRHKNHMMHGIILQLSTHLNQFFVALSSDSSSPTCGTAKCVGLTMVTIGGSGAPRIHLRWLFGVVFVICEFKMQITNLHQSIFLCCIIYNTTLLAQNTSFSSH